MILLYSILHIQPDISTSQIIFYDIFLFQLQMLSHLIYFVTFMYDISLQMHYQIKHFSDIILFQLQIYYHLHYFMACVFP